MSINSITNNPILENTGGGSRRAFMAFTNRFYRTFGIKILGVFLVLSLTLALLPMFASADDYVGGIPLTTVQTGTVTGDVWYDITPAPNWGSQNVTKTFTIPAAAVAQPGRIQWARLYISAYCAHMQNDNAFTVTNKWDGNGDGIYDQTWAETGHAPFHYLVAQDDGIVGNNNTAFGGGANDPYQIINDHENRVTSDYLMYYNVTSLIQGQTINVNVDTTGSSDGRIKVISLVVAYDDPASTTQTTYWVNQGHDVCSYYTEDNSNYAAVGSTTFATTGLTGVTSATLAIDYMASNNGNYGFPTAENNFEYTGGTPPVGGTFTNAALDRTPDVQGAYSGVDSWDVTSRITGSNDVTFAYSRYFPGTGTAAFYKIPLAILVAKKPMPTAQPVAAFVSNVTSGMRPLTVQFTDRSTNSPTSWNWEYKTGSGSWTSFSTSQNPSYSFPTVGTYDMRLTATNAGGSDIVTSTGYVSVLPQCDLTISGMVNPVPASAVFTAMSNPMTITNVKNNGPDAVTNFTVALYASDVSGGTIPVNSTIVASLASGATTTVRFTDPTIRPSTANTLYGSSDVAKVTYTAKTDPDNVIPETNEANNNKTSAAKPVYYNGYMGKFTAYNGNNTTTQHTYDLNGDIVYYTQPDSAYKSVGWTTRTETWTSENLPVPANASIVQAWLYVDYNWDTTAGGQPNWTTTFNGISIHITPGTPYWDQSNFGAYPNYKYGLYVVDVTSLYNRSGNTLEMTPNTGNSQALYPSTLAVIYSDPTATRKQIFINEECDELGVSESTYGTNVSEATSYVPFSSMTIDTANMTSATLHSFIGSAGPGEGNLIFNDVSVANGAWQGNADTASAEVFNVTSYLLANGNVAAIQGTTSGGMDTLQQFLVVEYKPTAVLPVADFTANTTSGNAPLAVLFDPASSTGTISTYAWDFDNNGIVDSTLQNPGYTYTTPGTYTVNLTVTGPGGSDSEVKIGYITAIALQPPVAAFTATPRAGLAPLAVQFTDQSQNATGWAWDFDNDGITDNTTQNPLYMYASAGTYSVNLTVTGPGGSNMLARTDYVAVSGGKLPLTTQQSGTVSGGLYVGAYQPTPWSNQPLTPGVKEFTQAYTIPAYTNIQWARLYEVVYAAGTDDRAGTATTSFDGNGDGTYETLLGTENLNIPGAGNGYVYWENDHVNRVYSDYMIWYNVTGLIDSQTVNAKLQTVNASGSTFDGRLKTLTLVVAYNDGDSDQVKYWVNQGHDYQGSSDTGVQTTFDTAGLTPGWASAALSNVMLSSKDANYTFNGHMYAGANPVSPISTFGYNVWDVSSNLSAGSDSTFGYTHASGTSYKTPLAFLTVTYVASPVAEVNATMTGSVMPVMMSAGESYSVSVTVRNTGVLSWNESSMFRLGMVDDNSGDAYKFDGTTARIWLPDGANVLPGQSVTFDYVMTAPAAGEYHPSYRMVWEDHQWFGEQINTTVSVIGPTLGATVTGNTIPTSMTAGTPYTVTVTAQNTGSMPWNESNMFRLGMINDENGDAYKFNGSTARIWLPESTNVLPGESYTFSFAMNPMVAPGTYHPSYRMVWEDHQWFGDTITSTVNVVGPDATITGDTIPTSMTTGQTYNASITVQNTGSMPWNESNMFRLGMLNDENGDAYKFNGTTARIWLPESANVLPGQSITFDYTMTAPTTGTYHPTYKMVWENHEWYGTVLTREVIVV